VSSDREQDGAGGRARRAELDELGSGAAEGSPEADEAPSPETPAAASEVEALRAERDALQDRLLRLAAEFDNHRKRTAREWREQKERAAAEVLREILELADNLERALAAPEEEQSLRRGVELILQQLQVKLRRFGVEPMETRGREFDPTRHEAILMVDAPEVESQHVVDEVQRGYLLHGDVLRPARVTVAR
jgi:molecular chaperone GrpE